MTSSDECRRRGSAAGKTRRGRRGAKAAEDDDLHDVASTAINPCHILPDLREGADDRLLPDEEELSHMTVSHSSSSSFSRLAPPSITTATACPPLSCTFRARGSPQTDDTSSCLPRRRRRPSTSRRHLKGFCVDLSGWSVALLALLVPSLIVPTAGFIDNDLVVETNRGKVRGVTLKSATNKDVDVWYGIPYAQPPVGKLRFRHPTPIDKWEGIMETTKLPNSCVQVRDTFFEGFEGAEIWNYNTPISEDCLYINVAVPRPNPTKAAVLVWIYGGGFYSGTSTLDVYDMRVLAAEENIIMVSMQYRVASLGFLYFDTEDADVPGNAGMFDQLMALQWIKDNIAHFGGNPDNITIFGESAGGAAVGLHLLSPLSHNLFSQAIMQSASAIVPWGVITKEEAIIRGLRLAELVKCPHDRRRPRETIDCLRQRNATELVEKEWDGIVFGIAEFPFVPIIDGSFLVESPQSAMKSKNFKKTNILMGANSEEGHFFILYYLTELFKLQENVYVSRKDFERSVGDLNLFVKEVGRQAIIYEYTDWLRPLDPLKNRDALDKMVGDYAFTCPVVDFAHRYAETGNNVYMYYFTERASPNPWPTWSGVLHADEIMFIFGEPLNRSKNYDQSEIALSKRMMAYWANFAKTGNPSLSADGTWTSTYWPVHTPINRDVLVLNANANNTRVIEGHRVKKCAFWRIFLPKLLSLDSPRPCDKACCLQGSGGGGEQGQQMSAATSLALAARRQGAPSVNLAAVSVLWLAMALRGT